MAAYFPFWMSGPFQVEHANLTRVAPFTPPHFESSLAVSIQIVPTWPIRNIVRALYALRFSRCRSESIVFFRDLAVIPSAVSNYHFVADIPVRLLRTFWPARFFARVPPLLCASWEGYKVKGCKVEGRGVEARVQVRLNCRRSCQQS